MDKEDKKSAYLYCKYKEFNDAGKSGKGGITNGIL